MWESAGSRRRPHRGASRPHLDVQQSNSLFRQTEPECAALSVGAFHSNRSLMRFDQSFANSQTQTSALLLAWVGRVDLLEAIKNFILESFRNSTPVIDYLYQRRFR